MKIQKIRVLARDKTNRNKMIHLRYFIFISGTKPEIKK